MRILVVEDEPALARDLAGALGAAGYLAETCADGAEAWALGDAEDYACVVLDLSLPGLDGLSVLRRWRSAGVSTPVLILTARGSWSERVEGIDAGADDYIAKPFEMAELLARLRAVLRRSAGHSGPSIRVGPAELDERLMRVAIDGVAAKLSTLEYRAAAHLLRNAGRVVSQQELLDTLYGAAGQPETNALEALIGRLRRKVGGGLIETRRGFGYVIRDPGRPEEPS